MIKRDFECIIGVVDNNHCYIVDSAISWTWTDENGVLQFSYAPTDSDFSSEKDENFEYEYIDEEEIDFNEKARAIEQHELELERELEKSERDFKRQNRIEELEQEHQYNMDLLNSELYAAKEALKSANFFANAHSTRKWAGKNHRENHREVMKKQKEVNRIKSAIREEKRRYIRKKRDLGF